MLSRQARVQPGEHVLIWGAAGGLGVFALQLCRLFGANPICVVSTNEKADFCRKLGADLVLDRRGFDFSSPANTRDFGRAIRALTGGDDPDVIFEHVGQETFAASVLLCKRFGRIVICGATTGHQLSFDVRHLWMRQKAILGSHFANYFEADRANQFVHQRKIAPVLGEVFTFDELPYAQQRQMQTNHMGKIAVLVGAAERGLGSRQV